MPKKNDWKKREGIVYSTSNDFEYTGPAADPPESLAPNQQRLVVSLDKRNRSGKQVTLISGFIGKPDELDQLARILKSKCGVGGSAKDGNILIQGDFRPKIKTLLKEMGFDYLVIS